jgi:hypothetical protein
VPDDLGGRLTGSIAVSFIPSYQQGSDIQELKTAALCGHCVVFSSGKQYWAPTASNEFVELRLSPMMPAASAIRGPGADGP